MSPTRAEEARGAPSSAWHEAQHRAGLAGRPREMAARGTHDKVVELLTRHAPPERARDALDIGAGAGALSQKLAEAGWRVAACDLYPDEFAAEGIECRAVEAGRLPFPDARFDVAVAVELLEHIEAHEALFAEVRRVLRPNGVLLITTPNILSLKSRVSFLLTGYPYSFPTLDPSVLDPVAQHITPFSLDRYRWRLAQSGFDIEVVDVDKLQRSSRALAFLIPLIRLATRRAARDSVSVREQNSRAVLFGRKLFIVARRRRSAA
ncbi:MAG TPA: class I SAM-dependent methyltransferase [Gammaproteobacteria bacterium]